MTKELLALDLLPAALAPQAFTIVALSTPSGVRTYRAPIIGAGQLPMWTTASRPVLVPGMATIGFNTTLLLVEVGFLSAGIPTWTPIGGGSVPVDPVILTATDMAVLFHALPTSQPGLAGMPWNNGSTIAFAPGVPSGTTTLTAAALAAMFAALPTTQAFGAGAPWNNGNTLAFNGGNPAGTTNWAAIDLALVFAGLPTNPPSTPYSPWANGHTLAFS